MRAPNRSFDPSLSLVAVLDLGFPAALVYLLWQGVKDGASICN